MIKKKDLKHSIDLTDKLARINVDNFENKIQKLKHTVDELKSIIDEVPEIEQRQPEKSKISLHNRLETIREKFENADKEITELKNFVQQSEIETDDLKLRICVLEDKLANVGEFTFVDASGWGVTPPKDFSGSLEQFSVKLKVGKDKK
jgi:predicted RNase H-like nuclease (RuvC/YqgF family)